MAHLHAEVFLEVELPGAIVGIGFFQHFDVPPNRRLGDLIQVNGTRCSFSTRNLPGENPGIVANGLEVASIDPVTTFVGMSPICPAPQPLEEYVVYAAEGLLAVDMPVIVGPSPQKRIELHDQVSGGRLPVDLEDRPDFLQQRLHVLSRRLDQKFAVWVLAYILPEEIEPVLNVSDRRFLRRELQSSLGKKRLHQRLNLVTQQLFGVCCYDEIHNGPRCQDTQRDKFKLDSAPF